MFLVSYKAKCLRHLARICYCLKPLSPGHGAQAHIRFQKSFLCCFLLCLAVMNPPSLHYYEPNQGGALKSEFRCLHIVKENLSPWMHSKRLASPKAYAFLIVAQLLPVAWKIAVKPLFQNCRSREEEVAALPNLLLLSGRSLPIASTQRSFAAAKLTSPSCSCRSPALTGGWSGALPFQRHQS